MPLLLISGLYFFCGIGLCVSDYRTAKRESAGGFFNHLKATLTRRKPLGKAGFKPLSDDGLESGHYARQDSPASIDTAESEPSPTPETRPASSVADFLTGRGSKGRR